MKTAFLESARRPPSLAPCLEPAFSNDRTFDQLDNPDTEFVAMLDAFRSTGGIAREKELALQLHVAGICTRLDFARWISDGRLLCFGWNRSTWLPLFQFESGGGSVHPGLGPVIASLRPLMSSWELAQWFAEPNVWLDGKRPADVLAIDSVAVLQAACADRFVISG